MLMVPRGAFVPPDYQAEAWVDSPIRVGVMCLPFSLPPSQTPSSPARSSTNFDLETVDVG